MAHIVTDRILETSTTTGTGAFALGGAVAGGFQDFDSQMANGDTTAYMILGLDGAAAGQWEVGLGTWNTGNTLSRSAVRSSNSNAAVNFSAGNKIIFMTFTPSVRQPGMAFTSAITPATNDLAALGSASLSWADLFLAAGGEINWNNGSIRLRDGLSNNLQFAAGFLETLAGTTTQPALRLPAGTLMTTPTDGDLEVDATNIYFTSDAGNRGYIPVRHFVRNADNRNLTNNTNENPLWDAANDAITLETGVYYFEAVIRVTNMSATIGNALIDWLGAGTAVVDTWLWFYEALDNSNPSPGPVAPTSVGWPAQQDSAASIAVAGTGTALALVAFGTFDVTTAGTLIPSIDLVTANAAVLTAGSFFRLERMGASNVAAVGQWA